MSQRRIRDPSSCTKISRMQRYPKKCSPYEKWQASVGRTFHLVRYCEPTTADFVGGRKRTVLGTGNVDWKSTSLKNLWAWSYNHLAKFYGMKAGSAGEDGGSHDLKYRSLNPSDLAFEGAGSRGWTCGSRSSGGERQSGSKGWEKHRGFRSNTRKRSD